MSCMKCLKYTVFAFNLLFWICGMAVLGLAIWLRLDKTSTTYVDAADQGVYYIGCYILMGAGGLMTIVGFLGCCGAYQENRCMLATFFCFLLIILLAEIGAGVYAYQNRKVLKDEINKSLEKFIKEDYGTQDAKRTQAVHKLHEELECCGASGPSDFLPSLVLDPSCCGGTSPCTGVNAYKTGCTDAVIEFFAEHNLYVMIIGFSIGIIEILGMVFSMTLCCLIHRRYRGYK